MNEGSQTPEEIDVPPELAARLARGEITLAEFVGLDRRTLYAVAQVGYRLLSSGRLEEAREIYRGLVAADPYDSVFHCHLAAVLHRLGRHDEAIEEYTLALRFNVANTDALAGRGELYAERGLLPEAVADLSAVLRLDPQGARISTVRAGAILKAVKEAIARAAPPDGA